MQKRVSVGVPVLAATLTTSLLAVTGPVGARPATTEQPRDDDPCARPWLDWPAAQTTDPERTRRTAAPSGTGRKPARATASSAAPKRPNIITIMVDDMRADELSGPWMQHTRRLIASQGASFENSFAPSPLCGPARASFFSGKYAHNTGVPNNTRPLAFDAFDDRNTLPVWLDRAGYNTAHVGKYLNGYGKGSLSGSGTKADRSYVPPGWDQWYGSIGGSTYRYWNTQLSDNGRGRIDLKGRYQTQAYGAIGAQLISRLSAERDPFYLDLSFTAPHVGKPREPDDPEGLATAARLPRMRGAYNDRITSPRGRPGEPCNEDKPTVISGLDPLSPVDQAKVVAASRQRAESLATVDDSIRRIFAALKRSGELDNTYILFTSDNGFFQGEFRQDHGKQLPYEPSLRTPTLVRGPGISAGITRQQPFTTIDFAPTVADMAGAKVGATVDGTSLLRSATGKDRGWSRPILANAGRRQGKEEYGYGVRMPGYAYHEFDDEHADRELFDLETDPHENHNVVDEARYKRVRATMSKTLERLRDCQGAQCRRAW